MLSEHYEYISDSVRLERYRTAIARVIKPGTSVLDIGAGSAILGLFCLQAGAGKITAIDETLMIEVAREAMARAGLSDRCEFIRGTSQRVDLAEKVDVVICDHVGFFGIDYGIVHMLQDARHRFLRPGGVVVPSALMLSLAAVDSQKCRDLTNRWAATDIPGEYHWIREKTVNTRHPVNLTAEELISAPVALGTVDLQADHGEFFSWSAELRIARDGLVDGIAGWFDCELAPGVTMTNSPVSDGAIGRPQAYLPIEQPVAVKAGDTVKAIVMARPTEYMLAWVVEFPATGQRFHHSTWHGTPLTPADLARTAPMRVPTLHRNGQARQLILGYCDGRRTVEEIKAAVVREHPNLFPTTTEIIGFVAQVLGQETE